MAFAIRNLSVLAYAQGFTLWHYKCGATTLSHASGHGYFDAAADMLATGDLMMISAPDGGRILVVSATLGRVATEPLS